MPVELLALILAGAAAALAQKVLNASRKKDTRELAPVRVRVERPATRRRG